MGIFPSIWKISFITPIPKNSPPSSSPSEYCPISLLCLFSKLLERHIFLILTDYLYDTGSFSQYQFGFLSNRSTSSALVSVTYHILSNLDSGGSLYGAFLDVKKAFYTASHRLVLKKKTNFFKSTKLFNQLVSFIPFWKESTSSSQCIIFNITSCNLCM